MSVNVVIETNEATRNMCSHPITDTARWEIIDDKGTDKIHEIYGITQTFPRKYEINIQTDFDSYMSMVDAVADDDMFKAHEACRRIQHEVVNIEIPFAARDDVKRDVSTMERCFLDRLDLNKMGSTLGKNLALLNPSTGTITRFKKQGLLYPIVIVGLDDDYVQAIRDRIQSEGYHVKIIQVQSWAYVPKDFLYYCGMSTDNAYRNFVPHFVGYALDPYAHLASGRDFTTSLVVSDKERDDPDMYFEYVRDTYVSKLYYYKETECYRYGVDAVGFFMLEGGIAKKLKFQANNVWTIMSSVELPIPPIKAARYDPPTVDVQRFKVDGVKLVTYGEWQCYVGEELGAKVIVDVLSAETRDRRDKYIGRAIDHLTSNGIATDIYRATPVNTGDFNYERFPTLAALVTSSDGIVEVARSNVVTVAQAYDLTAKNILDPRIIRMGDKVIIKKDIDLVQSCHLFSVEGKQFVGANKDADELTRIEDPDMKSLLVYSKRKSGLVYDFHQGGISIMKRDPDKESFELLRRLRIQKTPAVPVELRGYHPQFGNPSCMPEFVDEAGNGFDKRKGGGTWLVKCHGGTIVSRKNGESFMVHYDRTMTKMLTLVGYAARGTSVNRSTYMMMTGKMAVIGKFGQAVDIGESIFEITEDVPLN